MIRTQARIVIGVALGLTLWAGTGEAVADQVHYVGAHPFSSDGDGDGDGFCYIEVPHVHVYAPAPKHARVLYVRHDGAYHFVGDPVAFGYDGDKHPYYGHHPIFVNAYVDLGPDAQDDEYCYLDGPHFHAYAPPPSAKFELKGGAYWFVGKYSPRYRKHRRRRARINAVYRPLVYVRPVVEVEVRPAAYVGPIVEVEAPAVEVETPAVRAGIEVSVPVPSIEIGVSVPGVGVIVEGGHAHKHRHKKHRHRKHRGRRRGHRH